MEKPRKVGAKGAQTRQMLLDAAAKLFYSKGIAPTSLDEIAASAGVTKGAIYDHFASKNDLVFELFKPRGNPLLKAFEEGLSGRSQLTALRDFLLNSMPQRLDYVSSQYEFNHYIASNPDLGARLAPLAREGLMQVAARIEDTVPAEDRPLSAPHLTLALSALHTGLLFHRLIAPELVSDDAVRRIYDVIIGEPDPQPD